jgi:flagellar protein FlaG
MIIQNTSTNQGGPPVSQLGHDMPRPVADVPKQVMQQQPTPVQLKDAVNVINQVLRQANHSLEFSVDASTKIAVVKLIDTGSGELIRQIPSEEMLAVARSIDQYQQWQGLLLQHKA